jgi:hypothetical protein
VRERESREGRGRWGAIARRRRRDGRAEGR